MMQSIHAKFKPLFYYFFPFVLSLFVFTYFINKYLSYALVIILIFCYTINFTFYGFYSIKKLTFPIASAIVFVLFMLLSGAWAVYPGTAIKTALFTLSALIPGIYVYSFPSHVSSIKLFKIIVLFSLFFSLVTIISIIFPPIYTDFILKMLPARLQNDALSFYTGSISAGITDQTGVNAWFSVIGLGTCFAFYCAQRKKRYLFLIIVFFLAILFTAKRAHFLFSLLSLVIIYITLYKKNIRKVFHLAMLFAVIFIFLLSIFPNVFSSLYERSTISNGTDVSSSRLFLWNIALKLFFENPILGWGFGYFSNTAVLRGSATNTHNVYLQVLCELGIIGFLLFLIFVLSSFLSTFLRFKKRYDNAAYIKKIELIFSMFFQLFFTLYCFTGNPLNDLNIFSVYFFAICIAQSIKTKEKNDVYLGNS